MNKSTKFSYSRINTFNNCPQRYKIQYIDKIRKNDNSIEAFMGSRVHDVLENLYQTKSLDKKYISFDRLYNMYDDLWKQKWSDNIFISKYKFDKNNYNKLTLYKTGLLCLKNYYKRFNQRGYFKENIYATELKVEVKIGNYNFIGYIDRVDIDSDGIINIIDYKTGGKSKGKLQASKDLQMAIYEIAMIELFKEHKQINLNLYYLKNDKIITFTHSSKQLETIKNSIIERVKLIESTKNYIAKESILCEWCYYWNECDVKVGNNPSIKL
jgi:putative RecB family exonuclease